MRPNGRTLAVVEDHAAVVRHIYARCLALGTVRLLANELAAVGVTAPLRVRVPYPQSGAAICGMRDFSRAAALDVEIT